MRTSEMESTRVLIVDDHPVVRQGLRSLLSQYSHIQIVGEAGDIATALAFILDLQPDIVLLDIRLEKQSGLVLAQQLQRMESSARIILLTSYDDKSYVLKAAQAGVHGYLLKGTSPEVLAETIQAVQAGERRLSPEMGGKALEQLEVLGQVYIQSEVGLSEQELQLLELLAEGANTQDMSKALYLSKRTVKRKIQDILVKLGAANRAQAVAEAFKRGLL